MAYIFLDESGDLGFNFKKKGTSSVFVVTFLFIDGPKKPIEKIVSKTHAELSKKIRGQIGVLHATNERPITRQRLLKRLMEKDDCSIMTIYLNKKKVFTKLHDEKQVLYNYVTNILLDRIYTRKIVSSDKDIELIASRRETNRFLNDNFKEYLSHKVRGIHNSKMKVSIKTPSEEKCLQAVDFISWSIFRKYERGDDSYYNIIKKKIIEENPLFP
jgi:hypothetical protein